MAKRQAFTNLLNKNNLNSLSDLEAKSEVFKENEQLEEDSINVEKDIAPVHVASKPKGEKHLEFINSILIKASSENRGTIYTSKITHSRLKMLSAYTGINIFDLTDSILNDYFEKNKSQIELLRKKSSF